MATTLTATVDGVRCFRDGEYYYPLAGGWYTSGTCVAGYGYAEGHNYVTEVKFTTTKPASIFKISLTTASTYSGASRLNYLITTVEEDATYKKATYSVAGEGWVRFKSEQYTNSSIVHTKQLAAGTYYLYLWSGSEGLNYNQISHNANGKVVITYGNAADFDCNTEIAAKDFRDGGTYNNWTFLSDDSLNIVAGYGYNNDQNWVGVVRFVLPTAVSGLTFSPVMNDGNTTSPSIIRYKIISGNEDHSYDNATSATPGDGVFDFSDHNDWTRLPVTINQFIPAGVTYLYMWTDKSIIESDYNHAGFRLYPPSNTNYGVRIMYEELQGIAYIGTLKAIPEIYHNGEWRQVIPEVYTNGNWKTCS